MKYVRTHDNIYPLNDSKKYYDILKKEFYEIGDEHIYLEDIIKEANTIKDLCDEFVLIKNNNEGFQFWKDLDALKQCSGYFIVNDFDNVYGAIWTDKGLIYVAKLNEKGKLELLWKN